MRDGEVMNSAQDSSAAAFDFSGKTAVVTGGARGIGRAIAGRFATAGAQVIVADALPPDSDSTTVAGVTFRQTDVSDEAQVRALFDFTVAEFGRVDVLVNNAGVAVESSIEDTTVADWRRVMAVNATGVFLCAKHALRAMAGDGDGGGGGDGAGAGAGDGAGAGAGDGDGDGAGAGGRRDRAIVNIGSIEARGANPLHAVYAASKGAVHSLTRNIALEFGAHGIRCNAIAPGWIDTPFNAAFIDAHADPAGLRAALCDLHPVGRIGLPADVADAALWLASSAARFVTGQIITVDGGRTARLSLPGAASVTVKSAESSAQPAAAS